MHAVERPDEGGFATARRAHQRRHLSLWNVHGDVFDGVRLAIVDVQVADAHLDRIGDLGDSGLIMSDGIALDSVSQHCQASLLGGVPSLVSASRLSHAVMNV